ncbi:MULTISPECIES: hypothetical protein [unclassified Paenibacillus]|uniref:hypothetical protein n=1 Tax=unclassified Paenibacillus TaxID=185978 RepID=UPI0030FD1B2D
MRNKKYYITLIISVLICSLLLTSCEAITAQNITSADFNSRPGGFPGMNGGGANFRDGSRGMNREGTGKRGMQRPDGRADSTQ